MADSETGDFRSLPFGGGTLEQSYRSMQVIKLIQLNYRRHLNDKMKMTAKGKR